MKLIVEGRVNTSGKVDLDSGMFNACVIIDGQVAGEAQVRANGEYKLEFEAEAMPESVELKIYPSSVKPGDAGKMALSKKVKGSRFVAVGGKAGKYVLSDKFFLPIDYLEFIKRRTLKYHVYGTVYLEHDTFFSTLPGCRIDFYEVDCIRDIPEGISPVIHPDIFSITRRQDFLGSAYTRIDGSYDFYFKFGALPLKPGFNPLEETEFSPHLPQPSKSSVFIDYKPDIRARFYLFINGIWTRIYDAPMTEFDWNISSDYHRDYIIPDEAAVGAVDPGIKPPMGFVFKTVGLIPIDHTHIVEGYVHSQEGDPLGGISHEPFCGTLRIYGLFAATPVVTTYTVETLKANSSGTALTGETWNPLGEPLTNLQWNDSAKRWDPVTLSSPTGRYTNVDIEDPMAWLEPSLKAVWNTANFVNGYYILRITGYDAANTAVVTSEMPMICIDNDLPQGSIDVISPVATVCGDLTLGADRTITFQVTAYESEGHLHNYYLYGSRGRYAESAGAPIYHGRPVADANWDGVVNASEPFAIDPRSATTISCATMAYSFHLRVQAAGTNGYANCLESKRIWRETNLVVTE